MNGADTAWLLLRGIGFGLAVAAPVGPMSLLCMRRTLAQGWRPGLATGAGIAAGDGVYACVAVLGLASLSGLLLAFRRPMLAVAGLFLFWIGCRIVLARPPPGSAALPAVNPINAFAGSLLLTLTNPPTILTFAAIFASMAPAGGFTRSSAVATVGGVLAGSMGWWCGLVAAVTTLRHTIGVRTQRWIDRVAGSALMGWGAYEVARAILG